MKIGGHQLIPEPSTPPTTAWTVVFNFDEKPKRYDRDSYSPQLTDGRASTQEVDQVLSQIEAIRNPIDSKLHMGFLIWLGTLILMILTYAYLFLSGQEKSNAIVIPGIVWIIIFLIWLLRTIFLQNKFQDDCEEAFKNDVNRKFASRGLSWKISKEWPFWIELHNDFKKYSCQTRQQIAQQPGISGQNTGGQLHLQIYQGEPQFNTNLYMPPSQH